MLVRPWRLPEAWWAGFGAAALLATGIVTLPEAWLSIASGADVYYFLAGMMLLAEIARAEKIFDWTSFWALRVARGSPDRLFVLVFGLGAIVTAFLSNDATVVVLTPAVIAIAKRAALPVLPYAYACAFVANAASFVLPISNPANLVVYGGRLPTLGPWLQSYSLPSAVALAATYVLLRWYVRRDFKAEAAQPSERSGLTLRKRALFVLIASALVIVAASAFGQHVGVATALVALVALAIAVSGRGGATFGTLRRLDYSILVLVAALFVVVGALDANGALGEARRLLSAAAALSDPLSRIAAGSVTAALANAFNNLPVGLAARYALDASHAHPSLFRSILIGIDLGPNLSTTGSLATLLWLSALRAEGVPMTGARFLRAGAVVMPLALVLSVAVA
jgi:arsenical pump membrane protein